MERRNNISVGKIAIKVLVVLVLVMEVYPILWMLMASFKTPSEFAVMPSYSLPQHFYYQNYIKAWSTGQMSLFFKNSFIDTFISLFFITIFSVTASFAIAKMKWRFRKPVMTIFAMGITVPVTIVLIPLFIMYHQLNLLNTYFCLILTYTGFGLSLSIFLLVSYFSYVPNEIMESAVIDGCNIYKMLISIVLPLVKNAIVTIIVLQFFFNWNDLIFSMTFISETSLKTIQTGLMYFSDEYGQKDWGAIFASVSISIMPMLILYGFLNKMVIEGMTAGAVKG